MVKKIKDNSNSQKYTKKGKHRFDVKGLKKEIKNELYNQYSNKEIDKQKIKNDALFPLISKEEEDIIYNNKYTNYISEEFNSSIVNMIIIYINKNKYFPLRYQNESKFINKLINMLKHLLMNQFEIAYFTILLDKIGWSWKNVEHWTYFCILGIYTKLLCGKEYDSSLLMNIISRNSPEFTDYYTNFICDEETMDKINEKEINIRIINERFRLLNRPINTYCRKNYINYNGIVDKIVKLSQPYGDESNGNQLKSNEQFNSNNGIIDKNEIKVNTNKNIDDENDYNQLKYNLIMQPMISNTFSQRQKSIGYSSLYQSKNCIEEINNNNLSLNLLNKKSSQLSLKLDNFSNL